MAYGVASAGGSDPVIRGAPDARYTVRNWRPDLRCVQCDPAHFHGVLVELGKLWLGAPLALDTAVHLRRYGHREWQHLDGGDRALHGYALNLAHCFPSTRGTA